MTVVDPCASRPVAISFCEVATQFWRDFLDKEVQSAATYTYLWLADQMGHIALGLLIAFTLSWVFQFDFVMQWTEWMVVSIPGVGPRNVGPLVASVIGVVAWEWNSFRVFKKNANRVFKLDAALLRLNAITAAFYLALGCILGFTLQIDPDLGALATLISLFVALGIAVPWVRQKMVWQKAGLPFLARLSHIDVERKSPLATKATDIDGLIAKLGRGERDSVPKVVILTGPLGAGKTTLACAIGTECAFKRIKVRYTTFDKLGQLIAADRADQGKQHDDLGPENIVYWPWRESEVLIIDDIDSGFQNQPYLRPDEFGAILNNDFIGAARCIADRMTVWVFGEKEPAELEIWKGCIEKFLGLQPGGGEVSVVQYEEAAAAGEVTVLPKHYQEKEASPAAQIGAPQPQPDPAPTGEVSVPSNLPSKQPARAGNHVLIVPLGPAAPVLHPSVPRLSRWRRKPATPPTAATPPKTPTRDAA